MPVQTESNRLNDLLKWEQDNRYSREKVTVLSGQDLALATVVGKIKSSVPTTGTADGGNTGNGTMSGVAGADNTKIGTYTAECIKAAVDGGEFKVVDPDGERLDDAKVGVAYANDHLAFTINDGATDFVVGDKFTVTVSEGTGKVKQIDFAGQDGTEDAHGIMLAACDASSADTEGTALVRDAIIAESALVWPDGATAAQKAAALAQLKDKGIVTRAEA